MQILFLISYVFQNLIFVCALTMFGIWQNISVLFGLISLLNDISKPPGLFNINAFFSVVQ